MRRGRAVREREVRERVERDVRLTRPRPVTRFRLRVAPTRLRPPMRPPLRAGWRFCFAV
jgi:hypothetical protein